MLDPVLHFIDSLAADSALAAARRIDASPFDQRGALAGVPFLAKAGTSVASPVVGRLAAAGAVQLGTSTRPDPAAVCQVWGWNGRIPRAAGRSRAQLTVAGVIGADLADVVLATSIASGPDPVEPTALPHWPVPPLPGRTLTVGFSADQGYARTDPAVTPTTPQTAFPVREYEANLPAGDLCWAFNVSGHPAITVPAGLLDGLPVGLQAVAAPHQDGLAVWFASLAAVSLPIRRCTGPDPVRPGCMPLVHMAESAA